MDPSFRDELGLAQSQTWITNIPNDYLVDRYNCHSDPNIHTRLRAYRVGVSGEEGQKIAYQYESTLTGGPENFSFPRTLTSCQVPYLE